MKFTNPQNPIKMLTGGSKLSDVFVPITIYGDVAFFKALLLKLLEKEEETGSVYDKAFIKKHTNGLDAFI